MNKLTIINRNGVLVADSREVAEWVEKEHKNLARDIRGYVAALENSTELKFELSDYFIESTYQDSTGRTLPCYLITKKGCDMVANKMTGEKGIRFTAMYIDRFYDMESALRGRCFKSPPDLELQYQRVSIMDRNAKTRQAAEMRKFAELAGISDSYKQLLAAKAIEIMTGAPVPPCSESTVRTYTTAEIGELFQISTDAVGRLAKRYGLKTSQYGLEVWGIRSYRGKQLPVWMYYEAVIPVFARILGVDVPSGAQGRTSQMALA